MVKQALVWLRERSRRHLSRQVDPARIEAAIRAGEGRTSVEVRVSIAPFFWGNVRKVAERSFVRLGMSATAERNAVLFFVVPSRRSFVILGDQGIHQRVGQEFWEQLAAAVSAKLGCEGDLTTRLERGIAEVAASLAAPFPHQGARDANELPDAVDFGSGGESQR